MRINNLENKEVLRSLKLWKHQRQALISAFKYIDEFNSGKINGSALIHMPTGSGKSRVIGTLSQFIDGLGCVLILVPRIALRRQIKDKLLEKYFRNQTKNNADLPKKVFLLSKQLPEEQIEYPQKLVFVSTFQFLDSTFKRYPGVFNWLCTNISLIIVDEGHYEPAYSWSKVIRQIQKPKILFTATPFRNDFKSFDIDIQHRFSYSYHSALKDKFLRNIIIVPYPPHNNDPQKFIAEIIEFYCKKFPRTDISDIKEKDPRIIIRCDSASSIRQIKGVLSNKNISYFGIHEDFKHETDPSLVRHVPEPHKFSPLVWIHQFKLIEGIDDNRFRLLASFEPLSNTRAFVQQIGRIMRNPNWESKKQENGFVLDHTNGKQIKEYWAMFLEFDRKLTEDKILLSLGERFFKNYSEIQPEPAYLDKKFRKKFQPIGEQDIDPIKDFKSPLKTNLLEVSHEFDINIFYEAMRFRLNEKDKQIKTFPIGTSESPIYLIIYFTINNSPYLTSKYFLECSSDLMIFQKINNYLAFFDSSGFLPINDDLLKVGKAVSAQKLKKLLRSSNQSSIVQITLNNSHAGERAIRQSTYRASSLEKVVPNLNDHSQIVAQVVGYSYENDFNTDEKTKIRRYVGFNHGHITESQEEKSIEEYLIWLNNLGKIISGHYSPLKTFNRYSLSVEEPSDPSPKNILLDFFDVQEFYFTITEKDSDISSVLYIEDECQDIITFPDANDPDKLIYQFKIIANNNKCDIYIVYDTQKKHYILSSNDIDKLYKKHKITNEHLIEYLNKNQSFRIIPKTENYIYIGGDFYKPIIKYGRDFNYDNFYVGKIIEPFEVLSEIKSEKGQKCLADHSGWDLNSLFGIVCRLGKGTEMGDVFGNPDILICDDKQSEVADFILANTSENKVVFIHAKANKDYTPYSAGSLGKICEQAIKNIFYISMFNEQKPKNIDLWKNRWEDSKVEGYVKSRIILPSLFRGDPNILWDRLRKIISNPGAKREVWIMLGNTLYFDRFIKELEKTPATPAAIQAATLLHGTLTNISSMDVKLRIFCSP